MYNLVVFASGNGSTLQAIIDSIKSGELNAKINLVVSNNKTCYALERAKNNNIQTYVIKNADFNDIDSELYDELENPEDVFLWGTVNSDKVN